MANEPRGQRIIDHLIDNEVVYVRFEARPDEDVIEDSQEHSGVLVERVAVDGVEHLRFRASPADTVPVLVPAWQITFVGSDGVRFTCTAWDEGIDPRSSSRGLEHIDPADTIPLGLCPIHEL